MLLALAALLLSIIPVLIVGRLIAINLTEWRWAIPLVQMGIGFVVGVVIFELILSSPYVVVVATIAPLIINIAAVIHKRRQRIGSLNGKYGEATMWATELLEEEDEEFVVAMNMLEPIELQEVGIVAEDKQELRERTIERANEKYD